MKARHSSGRIVAAAGGAAAVWLLTMTVAAQGTAPPQAGATAAGRGLLAEEAFKNVQLLKGMPVDQFMGTMGFFAASTGLNCTDCHVDESGGSWARYADDNVRKQTTRRMMLMVNALNKANFGGRQVVTCFTCHRGSSRPTVMPSLDLLYSSPLPDEPGDPFMPAAGLPPPERVLDKYLQAVGPGPRLAAITSLVAKGSYIGFDDADTMPVDISADAQGRRTTVIHTLLGDSTTVFDGMNGWIAAPAADKPLPLYTVTGHELEGLKLEAQVFFPARIKQALTNWRTGFPSTINDRDVEVVQGNMPGGGVATLCFDAETGLLTRLVRYGDSPVGRIVTRVDYSDYRDVAGVKIPFKWTVQWLNGRSHFELTEAQPNTPIAAARFNRPAPSLPPRR
jgi:hypothetical protein